MGNQLALVTGASSGIGLSLAKELANRGYDLAICSAGERLDDAAEALKAMGGHVYEIQADLSTRKGVEQLCGEVTALNRNLDIACINAGRAFYGRKRPPT
jgi:NAD(P)-dependent dehydrogenase (short-subunit alcohol dehydrogenase family)